MITLCSFISTLLLPKELVTRSVDMVPYESTVILDVHYND